MQLIALLLATSAVLASAQIVYNSTTDSFDCPPTGGNFCPAPSLQIGIIIHCNGAVGQPGNCADNLAGVPPAGLKSNALCYQSSPTAGDASCTLNGIVYPETGAAPFPISGINSTSTNSTTSTSASTTTGSLTTTPTSNVSITVSALTSAVTSTNYVFASALSQPLSAMTSTVVAPYPTPTLINGTGGLVTGTGTSGIPAPTSTFVSDAGAMETGAWLLRAGIIAAAAAVLL